MSYQTHNFQDGTKLYASELNEMDEQIKLLSEQETGGGAKTELIYNGTNISKSDGTVVNFADLVNLLKVSKDFVYLLYSDRAYLPTLIHDTGSGMKYIYFESTMIDGGHSKNAVIQVNSSNGTDIASIGTQSTVNENSSNKVNEITERNSADENAYPSNKAVAGYVGAVKTDVANLKEELEEIKALIQTVRDEIKNGNIDEAISLLDTFLLDEGVLE